MKRTVKSTSKLILAVGYIVSEIKRRIVSRMFWGRSNFYKNISHFLMLTITVLVTLSGFIYRVKEVSASQTTLDGTAIIGSDDLLTQGGSISTVLKNDTNNLSAIQTNSYTV